MRIAVIADVHGNRWALEAVLAEIDRRQVDRVVDLGDSVYGPLDPGGTADLLIAQRVPSIRGNGDRIVLETPGESDSQTLRYTRSCLSAAQLRWLQDLPVTRRSFPDLLCCHGTPARDDAYLLETLTRAGVRVKAADELELQLRGVRGSTVLCGHSHVPRFVELPGGPLIVNPGSVGLPAYRDANPVPHAMESGSPHARFAIVERTEDRWRAELVKVPYDWSAASKVAASNGRPDWRLWLDTGCASLAGEGQP